MKLFHGTNATFKRFLDNPDVGFSDGGISLTIHEPLARCYGSRLIEVAIPDTAMKLLRVSIQEWFHLTDQQIEAHKLRYDGVLISGDVLYNAGPDDDFQPEDATFFWDWVLLWNIELLNNQISSVTDFGSTAEFADLSAVVSRARTGPFSPAAP